ncbi:MAG: undecaprenyl diphosphate synthase family protein [Candidatus Woesearchaeota archaeon]|nr:undecaprenyl diphosphate synthase family protein [Candidatus Woesearchaeota archaeon]
MVIDKIKDWINLGELFNVKEKILISRKELPKHIAMTTAIVPNEENYKDLYQKKLERVITIVRTAIAMNVPILTFDIMKETEMEYQIIDPLVLFFKELKNSEFIIQNQIKIAVLGKWYDLPGRLVEEIKGVINSTKDFDRHFVNLCINYDGQQEIVDALKLIGMQVMVGKVDPSTIDRETVKENLYSSQFLPPDLFIKTGSRQVLHGLLLWDSASATIYFTQKSWLDFDRTALFKEIEFYQNQDETKDL